MQDIITVVYLGFNGDDTTMRVLTLPGHVHFLPPEVIIIMTWPMSTFPDTLPQNPASRSVDEIKIHPAVWLANIWK